MSETSGNKISTPARRSLFIILGGILLLALGYLGGYFILPRSTLSAYQDKNCDSTLSRHELYGAIYPAFMQDKSLESHIMECAVHVLAAREEQNGDRSTAYAAYRVYADTYPNGLFVEEAKDQAGEILIGLVREQLSEKKYHEAMESLNLVLSQNANTSAATDAEELYAEIYRTWGADLRHAADFEGAQRVFADFNLWAQGHQRTDQATSAQYELAQTYLAWGLSLQSRKKFEEAVTKFDLAAATDPEPQSNSGAAAQVKANQAKFYQEWGDALIQRKDFTGAMEIYGTAAISSGSDDPTAAQDLMAGGYVQWAAGVGAEEDFLGALILLDFAQANATTDATKTLVEEARSDLYRAFSQSSGEQAGQAMRDAVRIVCEHQAQPRLPIFGLDQENMRVGVHGADEPLPDSLAATTPASLHHVACIEEENRIVQTLRLPISTTQFGLGPGIVHIDYRNYQYVWNVVLREVAGDEVAATVIEGTKPAALGPYDIAITTFSYFGPKPEIEDLADWILTAAR